MATVTVEISDMSIFEKFKEMCSRFKEIASVRVEDEPAEPTPAQVERMLERAYEGVDKKEIDFCFSDAKSLINSILQ